MSPLEVAVHVNRDSPQSLETDVSTVETCEPFDLVIYGHETPAHVHCRLDDGLDRAASIDGSNYFIEPGHQTTIPVRVTPCQGAIEGTLEIVTGYGTESIAIDVTVRQEPQGVPVDESLAQTAPDQPAADRRRDRLPALTELEPGTIAVLVLGALSIGIALVTAATIGGPMAIAGLVIVVVGVAIGLFLLMW